MFSRRLRNRLRKALAKVAPEGVEEPTIVVLTPGVYNSAYYEHSLLARTMAGCSWAQTSASRSSAAAG